MAANEKKIYRGVFLLPNALTTGALFAGFYSIISGINGHTIAACIAIIVAGLLDGLDGRVARMTNTQSEFGVQYDSLSDLISFGLAPALLAFNWSLASMQALSPLAGKLGWLAAFVYVACAALRLARFNAQAKVADKAYFQGMATPAAAGILVVTIWFLADQGVSGETVRWLMWFETIGLGLLMFSHVRYFSFKSWPRGDRIPVGWLILLVMGIVLLAVDPPAMLLLIGVIYLCSGLIMTVTGKKRWKQRQERRSLAKRGKRRPAGEPDSQSRGHATGQSRGRARDQAHDNSDGQSEGEGSDG
jgi:CDP-diacylglycerol--serine O-phosphatidyltransferase